MFHHPFHLSYQPTNQQQHPSRFQLLTKSTHIMVVLVLYSSPPTFVSLSLQSYNSLPIQCQVILILLLRPKLSVRCMFKDPQRRLQVIMNLFLRPKLLLCLFKDLQRKFQVIMILFLRPKLILCMFKDLKRKLQFVMNLLHQPHLLLL